MERASSYAARSTFKMKGSPMQRNFGIGIANSSGASGLSAKGSPMKWTWLINVVKAAASKVGAVAMNAGAAVTKGASWITGGAKTAVGRGLGKVSTNLASRGAGMQLGSKTGMANTGKFGAKYSELTEGIRSGKKGKLAKKALEYGESSVQGQVIGSLTARGDDYQPQESSMPQLSFGSSASGKGDHISQASGLTYKKKYNYSGRSPVKSFYDFEGSAKSGGVGKHADFSSKAVGNEHIAKIKENSKRPNSKSSFSPHPMALLGGKMS
jgi:hypothetical protein